MSATVYTFRTRDDYGRSVLEATQSGRVIAVLVTIPKRTNHLTQGTHFINHLASSVDQDVTWYPNQRAAKAAFNAIIAAA